MIPVAFTGMTMVTITFGPSLPSAAIMVVAALVSVGLLAFGVGASAWLSWCLWRLRRQGQDGLRSSKDPEA